MSILNDKQQRIVNFIINNQEKFSEEIEAYTDVYSLTKIAECQNPDELNELLSDLVEKGFIRPVCSQMGCSQVDTIKLSLIKNLSS